MSTSGLLIVVLAAGKGTRMRSRLPKVLHQVAGRSLLGHVLAAARTSDAQTVAVVVGPGMNDVRDEALRQMPEARVLVQAEQRGTGDATLAARSLLVEHSGNVLVVFGDTPLLDPDTLRRASGELDKGADVVVVGFETADPTGYGRILRDRSGRVLAIREHKDASEAERAVAFCNSGVMGFRSTGDGGLVKLLESIGNANAKGEYYLTDAVQIARGRGMVVAAVTASETEVQGINDRVQLAQVEAVVQGRLRRRALLGGATLIAPETVHLSHDTVLGEDVVVEPFVVFGPGVTVAGNALIHSFTHVVGSDRKSRSGASIGEGVELGPFARLRPGAVLGKKVHVGNFVEVKNAVLEEGAKANHLTYLGDARIGPKANIGAGTITCNYDGFEKYHTDIGAGAFIGSNTALIAPVKVGDGAIIGAGTVVAKDVAADALALTRAPHDERQGWAARFRAMMERRKKKS